MSYKKSLYLIDGNAYIHRAYHAFPPLSNSHGEPVHAIFGFAKMLLKMMRQEKPDYMAVCFDTPAPTFRHKAFEAYKAHRKEIDDELKFQLPLCKELAAAWGFPVAAKEGYEADDLIATLAHEGADNGLTVVIVSGDKDTFQLVNEQITVLNEHKGIQYTCAEVEKKYKLRPDQMIDFFALTGDASDNVPGVPGIGEKTAVQVLHQCGSLDGAYTHLDDLKPAIREKLEKHKDQAMMSRDLVILDRHAPVGFSALDCSVKPPDVKKLTGMFKRFEFVSLLKEMFSAAPASANASCQVRVVLSEQDLNDLKKELSGAEELSVDVETTGTDPLSCDLVGISLAVQSRAAWYIPLKHSYLGCPNQLSLSKVKQVVGPFLEDDQLPKTGQNLKYDFLVLQQNGLLLRGICFDTLLASYCLNPSRFSHSLKQLSLDLLGESMTAIDELLGKGAKQITMDQVDVSKAAQYAGADAEVVLRLKKQMLPQLKEKKLDALFFDVEMPLLTILADMEKTGIQIDLNYLRGLQQTFKQDIAALENEMFKMAGHALNLNSPKQLSVLLFEEMKLPVIRKTKTGFSTDEEVLRQLSKQHPLPAKLLEYRELSKLKSTYIDALLMQTQEDTGRVHSSFNQAITATGRLSSSDPNLQNIPIRSEHGRLIRKSFVPAKGFVFLSADYSQIDLRVLAHVSKDPALGQAFHRGEDVHSATAREIFDLAPSQNVDEEQRRVAKSVNFGIVYGQTSFGLSQQLGIPMAQAQDYIDKYFLRYAGIQKWVQATLDKARQDGYVTTLLNRIRYLPDIQSSNKAVRGFSERTAMNTPIQGTSADIIKVAMRDVAQMIQTKKWSTRMLLQVHDDLLFEVPEKELEKAAPLIREKMEKALTLDVPVAVDLKTGKNWAEMEKLNDFEISPPKGSGRN